MNLERKWNKTCGCLTINHNLMGFQVPKNGPQEQEERKRARVFISNQNMAQTSIFAIGRRGCSAHKTWIPEPLPFSHFFNKSSEKNSLAGKHLARKCIPVSPLFMKIFS